MNMCTAISQCHIVVNCETTNSNMTVNTKTKAIIPEKLLHRIVILLPGEPILSHQ